MTFREYKQTFGTNLIKEVCVNCIPVNINDSRLDDLQVIGGDGELIDLVSDDTTTFPETTN